MAANTALTKGAINSSQNPTRSLPGDNRRLFYLHRAWFLQTEVTQQNRGRFRGTVLQGLRALHNSY